MVLLVYVNCKPKSGISEIGPSVAPPLPATDRLQAASPHTAPNAVLLDCGNASTVHHAESIDNGNGFTKCPAAQLRMYVSPTETESRTSELVFNAEHEGTKVFHILLQA
jgi:hypothetical protein